MKYKIVSDSSADLLKLEGIPFASVPLHILVGEQEFIDNAALDISAMQSALESYKGKTSTSCPSPAEWIASFEEADVVFCFTISGKLSGSASSARTAKQLYENDFPGKRVYVIDSLSTGPEMTLLIEKTRDLMLTGADGEEIYRQIKTYMKKTHLFFVLASVDNLAKNGRVSPLLAKGMGLLGLRVIGTASDAGELTTLEKCRGEKKAITRVIQLMKDYGYKAGQKVIIAHHFNERAAAELQAQIKAGFGEFCGYIQRNRGLCGYYAEPNSFMVGFEV